LLPVREANGHALAYVTWVLRIWAAGDGMPAVTSEQVVPKHIAIEPVRAVWPDRIDDAIQRWIIQ
jgi:hypothetical protein